MNGVFREYLYNFVFVFLDDILVYPNIEKEDDKHLRKVLQVLGEHQLYAKLSKCEFYHKKIKYLGNICWSKSLM